MKLFFRFAAIAAAVTILALLSLWGLEFLRAPKRVHREHLQIPSLQFEELAFRPMLSVQKARIAGHFALAETSVSRKEAEQDLDELEWLIENTYSYRDLKGIDYRAALDTIRGSFGDRTRRGELAYQLTRFLALFGDGHSQLSDPSPRALSSSFLPFLVQESDGRLVAFKPDRSGFLEPGLPFIRAMDGLAMDEWLKVSSRLCADGSSQYVRHNSIRGLRYIELLREDLRLQAQNSIQVELESLDGKKSKQIELFLAPDKPIYGLWPKSESGIVSGNIGYLRIPLMNPSPEFIDDMLESMHRFKDTVGLIIDVRGNGGGSRAPLRRLFPFFMAPDDVPRVVNVAAYRLGIEGRRQAFERRYLYPASFSGWTEPERAAIGQFAATFQPEWPVPKDLFSEWHYFIIGPHREENGFYYANPVIILMDSACFSATDVFLGAFKGWRNVTLVGSPSGGGSGCRVSTRLKHSMMTVTLSSMVSFRANGQLYDTRGVLPDILLQASATDFLGETDSILKKAVQHITELTFPTSEE